MAFELEKDFNSNLPVIKVIGVGGGGGNAVNRMVEMEVRCVEFIAINTDNHVLSYSRATQKIQIGEKITHGKGAGSKPEIGEKSAEENREEIAALLRDADMVFITAGMGGGTGTGAAPVVAEIAKNMGILTVAIVTKPFAFEGKRRMEHAERGIAALKEHVDSLVVVPNERLKYSSEQRISLQNAFEVADDVLRKAVQSISDLILIPGLVNLDFADVTSVMKEAGYAHMGVGHASGKDKAEAAANMAMNSPLLETSIGGAKGVIINITASPDIGLDEIEVASAMITKQADDEANIIWGAVLDENMDDEMSITVIATGFYSDEDNTVYKESTNKSVAQPTNTYVQQPVYQQPVQPVVQQPVQQPVVQQPVVTPQPVVAPQPVQQPVVQQPVQQPMPQPVAPQQPVVPAPKAEPEKKKEEETIDDIYYDIMSIFGK